MAGARSNRMEADFGSVFASQRTRNARWLLRIRAVAVVLWFLDHWAFGHFGSRPEYLDTLPVLGAYAVAAWLLLAVMRARPDWLRHSWLALVLLDMPASATIQYTILFDSPSPGVVAGLTVAILAAQAVLAQLWLGRLQTIGVAAVGALIAMPFMVGIGQDPSTVVGAALVMLVVGATSTLVVGQIHGLVHDVVVEAARKERLGRYLSPAVRDEVLDGDSSAGEGALRDVTVLFLDIRGFTAISDDLPPRDVVELLNQVHGRMVDVLFAHGGTLDKFLGDGLMGWFGAPLEQPDHARAAALCARDMCRALDDLNTERARDGRAPLAIGIGLHTGEAVIGDIGTRTRAEYTAIGDTVNTASRIESLTRDRGVQVLVSEVTRAAAGPCVEWIEVGPVDIRGKAEPMRLAQLVV